jgi:hypothetical protein
MRRLTAVLLSLLLADVALAGVKEDPDREAKGRGDRFGRAMILHPKQVLSEADIADLASRGIKVTRPISGGRYIARVQDEVTTVADARIASLEPMTSRMKLHPSVVREAALAKPRTRVNVIFHRDVDFDAARDAIIDAGGELDDFLQFKFSPSQRVTASVPPAALQALVADERVMTIVGATRRKPRSENATSAAVHSVTPLYDAPYGLSGEGVHVSLFELAEAQGSHVEFGGRFTVNAAGGTTSDKSHATHVAGIIGAAGVNAAAKGMAPKSRIHEYCLSIPGQNQCEGDWLDLKDEALTPLGIIADNNSWGFELGWYTEDGFPVWDGSEIFYGSYIPDFGGPFVDDISIERKVLFVHSAGNDGNSGGFSTEFQQHRHVDDDGDAITTEIFCYSQNDSGTDCPAFCNGKNPDTGAAAGCEKLAERHHTSIPFDTIGVVSAAKNVIAVGAVSAVPGNALIAGLSSRGPAKDGRVKPDVVARGTNVLSPVPTDAYERKQGTSMASPVVTGIAALLIEQWRRTFAGANPLPEQLKALILAGADDMGNPGPDYTHGFGLVNAKTSVDLIRADGGTGARIQTMSFPEGQNVTREIPLVVSQPQNLRVLVNWSDPPIVLLGDEDISVSVLVNDLDLKVIDPSGATHLPYVLDKAAFTANATRGENRVDNTEEVEIANAPAGTYRVQVRAHRVADGPQSAVVVANAALTAPPPPCKDVIEALGSNDTSASAFGNLAPNQQINAGLCSQGDVDYYKFVVTKTGQIGVTVTTGDTPLRVTLSPAAQIGIETPTDIPANTTRTITAVASLAPVTYLLRIEAAGALGTLPQYSFSADFAVSQQPRRRATAR